MTQIRILDGGMGTMLQGAGMKPGERTEVFGMEHPAILEKIQKTYIDSGSDIIYSNTFGANARKLKGCGYTVSEVIRANVRIALYAAGRIDENGNVIPEGSAQAKVKVALDIGPIGELMEPLGTLKSDEAYEIFREMLTAGTDAGADLVIFETMSDLSELRAGVLAAAENTDLPIWTTMSFEKNGRTFSGTTLASFAMTMDGLPVEALGINCSLGPAQILPFIKEIRNWTDKPLIVKPNAGLPDPMTGEYDLDAEAFAGEMTAFADAGVSYMGGCCGTTPEFIRKMADAVKGSEAAAGTDAAPKRSGVCSSGKTAAFGKLLVIGERINPTGKKRLQQALKEHDLNYILKCALEQESAGADILDINVGLPGIDEPQMMAEVVKAVQGICSLPLQIDSSDPAAIEAGLRAYNGKAIVNSVNGEDEKLDEILPLVKKYGASVIGLTMDKGGLPETCEQRIAIAEKILERALAFGISKDDVIIDCLALTISSMQDQAQETLKAVREVTERLGLHTTLGVSNISFGLPEREHITASFLAQAVGAGLDMPIINPNSKAVMDVIASVKALSGQDGNCTEYIERFAAQSAGAAAEGALGAAGAPGMTIEDAIVKGLGDEVASIVEGLLSSMSELEIIDEMLIPALDVVGIKYEKEEIFLPQLISAANAAGCGFEVIRKRMAKEGNVSSPKGTIILATVEGDIHDIGKNIVKVVLENYGYRIIDLGKDVPPQKVVDAAIEGDVRLIGLSALMTTTVESMKRTIDALRASGHDCRVMVGGAVLTEDYAKKIGADFYGRDAKASADYARRVLG